MIAAIVAAAYTLVVLVVCWRACPRQNSWWKRPAATLALVALFPWYGLRFYYDRIRTTLRNQAVTQREAGPDL